MRMPPLAVCVASSLLLFAAASGWSGIVLIAPAKAQSQKQMQPQSLEDLYEKCKRAVFLKYGRRLPEYVGKKIGLPSSQFVRALDQCVASTAAQ